MASYYGSILEEELKNKVAEEWFADYDATQIIGRIDFSVAVRRNTLQTNLFGSETEYLLWAEAKQGTTHDIYESFVQLILTIGKARTFDDHLPPRFLGAFDAEKMAFLPYTDVMEVFTMNDFNWNVAPNNHSTREFLLVLERVRSTLDKGAYIYRYDIDGKELSRFIKRNFRPKPGPDLTIRINKNNFTHIYLKWLAEVMPSIDINWAEAKKEGLLDADFYLADILSRDNKSIKDKLYVLLETDKYRYNIHRRLTGSLAFEEVPFKDGQKAHIHFWLRYTRPPQEEYWDYIVERRDLLVPQDIRERKGSFFTPSRWVELSQEYIARELGEDWQDEYYVWDCCAGTGNLLAGLTNKWNVFASTLDTQDVRAMHDLISTNRLNLLANHVFQFDFLNDSFDQLPDALRDIINDPEKRRKLVIYINPPYAEVSSVGVKGKKGVNVSRIHEKYQEALKCAGRELFVQFLIRVYKEIPDCILAEFSTLKILQGAAFHSFRQSFQPELHSMFICPAYTFDNVNGQFPIGFMIWDCGKAVKFDRIDADIYNDDAELIGTKRFSFVDKEDVINKWTSTFRNRENGGLGFLCGTNGNDFQQNDIVYILNKKEQMANPRGLWIVASNIIQCSVYFAVRHCIEHTWINHNDQFLYPKDTWMKDKEFQSDCLAYTIFYRKNFISSAGGTNHWIPFTEDEVDAKERFESHFMSDFIRGKHKSTKQNQQTDLFATATAEQEEPSAITFSAEAQAVMDAGRALWRYYHSQPHPNPNASFYDIRLHFQGTNDKGKMNPDSEDAHYTELIKTLRTRLRTLADKLAPKVYAHGFLLQ